MKKNNGFTLVEVIIAIALTAIIAVTITTAFGVSVNANTVLIKKAENQSDVRYAATYLRQQVREADHVNTYGKKQIGGSTPKIIYHLELNVTEEGESKTKNYYIDNIKNALIEEINETENELVYNIGGFTADLDKENNVLIIMIKSVEDKRHQGATIQEEIVMNILASQISE